MNPEVNQEWFTLKEAQEFTRLSASLLRAAVASGRLKSARSNGTTGKLIFHRTWLSQFILGGVSE